MFKILAFSFNLIALLFFNFLLEDVTVEQNLPDRVEQGNEFVVTVTIDKSTIEGYAKFQVVLPEGVTATEIETGVAKFNFESKKAKFVWMTLPEERVFEISYKVTVNDPSLTEIPVGGTFSYLDENQRMTVDLPARIVKMGKEVIIVEEIPEAEVTVARTIKSVSEHLYLITLDIHYSNITGFAKIQDIVPSGSDVRPEGAEDAVFSILDTKVKYVWMNFPEDGHDISVSYFVDLTDAESKKISEIAGEFAFIHDGESRKIQITNPSAIDFVEIEKPELAVKETPKEVIPVAIETVDLIEQEIPAKKPVDIPVTSTPSPQTGVIYKVQVMAAHKSVNVSTYFNKIYKFSNKVEMDAHQGWMKYLTGGHDKYVSARDMRNSYNQNYTFKGPFVVAYNNGERITVQEALMITNQKWVN